MADPLSIAASLIAVVGAAIAVSDSILSLIHQVTNAPNEVMNVHNDITDVRLVLCNVEANTAKGRSLEQTLAMAEDGPLGNPQDIAKVELLLRRTELTLTEIDYILRTVIKAKSPNELTLHQRAWLLNRSKLRVLRDELRGLKISLAVHFSASSSAHAHRSVILLKRVLLEHAEAVQRQAERSDQFDATLRDLAEQLAELRTIPESQRQLVSLMTALNGAVITSEQSSRRTTTTRVIERTSAVDGQSSQNTVLQARSRTVTEESVSRLKLEFSRFQKRACAPDCECSCHLRRRYQTPKFMEKLVGQFFVGFSSLPLLSQSCTDARCTEKSPFSATVTYYLPIWLLRKMVSLVFITTSQGDPAACIKVRPLNSDFTFYRAVEQNRLQDVQNMLEKRTAHPSAGYYGGWTPLHYAIDRGHAAICRSLLAKGADPHVEDGTFQTSALEWAWTKILGRCFEDETQQEMEELFSDRDCLEEMLFTPIHRIVLGLNGTPLEQELLRCPSSVNSVDANGRTPLSWAAQRGMVDTVKTLLRYGADPNIYSLQGHSPLHYAAEARDPSCLQPLLDYGADVNQCDIDGQTAIHYAAQHRSNVAYFRPLIEANCNPNKPTQWDMTPLNVMIVRGFAESLPYLLDNGADMNLKAQDQAPPVFWAVQYNNTQALSILQERGADLTASSTKFPTIAHVAAHHANVETLRLLTSFRLRLSDMDCVDSDGFTIPDILHKRLQNGLEDEQAIVEAFRAFLGSIDSDQAAQVDDVKEEDEFHDALESINEPISSS